MAKQDALIVFSRKNVHAVASELQTRKIKCSVLYGNLPYDVRQKEAEKFLTGETSVVVATDAIGMGMNLPIKRIVFLETDKFDGKDRRSLFDEEFRQIAGRAGRRGIYEKGYVNAVRDKKVIRQALSTTSADLTKAVIRFPDSLLGIDARLSETINRWKGLFTETMFEKADVEILYSLCKELELKSDDKKLIYSFLMIPFDEGNADVKAMWHELFDQVLSGNDLTIKPYLPDISENRTDSDYLSILEKNYRICDLLYAFCERFCDGEDIELVMEKKKLISAKMIRILEKQKLVRRKCKRCGRLLSWNTPYTICDHCYYGF